MAFGEQANRQLALNIGNRRVSVGLQGKPAIAIDGRTQTQIALAQGRIRTLGVLTDAELLSFTGINRRIGMLERTNSVPNVTFETAIPWTLLDLSPPNELLVLSIRLSSDDYELVLPAAGSTGRLVIDKSPGKTQ